MTKIAVFLLAVISVFGKDITTQAEVRPLSHSFEFRYVDDNPAANGETDFKGRTAVFNTQKRVEFLYHYAEYAKSFFNDPKLDTQVVSDREVNAFIKNLKQQPLPRIRKRLPLEQWRWIGYRPGERKENLKELSTWNKIPGVKVENGHVLFSDKQLKLERSFVPQTWRFSFQLRAKVPQNNARAFFCLCDNKKPAVSFGFNKNGRIFYITEERQIDAGPYSANTWYTFKLEVDLVNSRYNFYVDNQLKADFVKLQNNDVKQINGLSIETEKGQELDEIWGVGYLHNVDPANLGTWARPYSIHTFINQDFNPKPSIENWNRTDYDDSEWQTAALPIVHGGERYTGEDLYLRKSIKVGDFQRAVLNVETLDPGGEVWVNGQIAAVLNNRHPAKINITEYLKPNAVNSLAVKVKHYQVRQRMQHTPTDVNIGWFAGRMSLDLTDKTYIDDVFVYAKDVSNPANMQIRIPIKNTLDRPFTGNVLVNFYQWYPNESSAAAARVKFPVRVRAWSKEILKKTIPVPEPKLWTSEKPNLYKVEVILQGESGKNVDDYVVTTGIRTVTQKGGTFRINGKPEMLNGAQIMGFRMPLDKIATWNRCAPQEWLAKELLMIKKMNGNMMRVHVHAWQNPARNINDPRLAEMGDQLGVMFIWATTAWIRTGQCWGIDFEGYPKYVEQVYNHPSIVMWEASNHPNKFKKSDVSESNLFYEKVYKTIYPIDPSRLISAISHIRHTHYGNDLGTIDYRGNPMQSCPAWTAPMVTRGNQDSITGYGKEWSVLRKWPDSYTKNFLKSKDRAYFNFEHEESIGQPNWSLVKGKPWYKLQSYEWDYDTGSIGRRLTASEWQQSQAWQAFSAYESMKKQRILDYDGFSWCCLHGGPNTGTYKKPLIDCLGNAKLAFYTNKMVFQKILAASNNVDVVYGPNDEISPVIMNLGPARTVKLMILVRNAKDQIIDSKTYPVVNLSPGRTVTSLPDFKPAFPSPGYYAIEYMVTRQER